MIFFFFWRGTEAELLSFIDHLNSQHPHIKFTATYDINTRTIPFLDMQVSINEAGFVETDLYRKETTRCQYLLPSSCHPGHITKNIPYSLAYRLLRICSAREKFMQRLEELRKDLMSRSYNTKVVSSAFDRVCLIKREDALKRVSREASKREPFVLTYHPALPSVSKMVRKHWKVMVDGSTILKRCFPQPSVVAYKRSKNLKDMLIRSKVKNTRASTRNVLGFKPCKTVCAMCLNSPVASSHRCYRTGQEWKIAAKITCKTKNVVYKLSCLKCPEFVYIGETGRRIMDRIQEHRGYINQKRQDQPAGQHFNLPGHDYRHLVVTPIERVLPVGDSLIRKSREKLWIERYDAVTYGANTR